MFGKLAEDRVDGYRCGRGELDCNAAGSSCLSGPRSSGISATDSDALLWTEAASSARRLAVPDLLLLLHRNTDSFLIEAELVTDTLFPSGSSNSRSTSGSEGGADTSVSLLFGPTSATGVQVRSALNIGL